VDKIAIVKFSRTHSGFGGVLYNKGECAAFSEKDAEEIVELASGDIIEWRDVPISENEAIKREGIQSPPQDKMVSSTISKKTEDSNQEIPRARSRRPTITENLLNQEGDS
jgi:hypothetical protein